MSDYSCNSCTKVKYTCGEVKTSAYCTYIDKNLLPEWSELKDEDCLVVYETTKELYNEVDKLKKEIEIKESPSCFDYNKNDDGKITIKTALETIIEKAGLCGSTPKNNESNYGNVNGGSNYCYIDYKGLIPQEPCMKEAKSICEHIQNIVNIMSKEKGEPQEQKKEKEIVNPVDVLAEI